VLFRSGSSTSYTAPFGTGLVTCQAKDAAGNLSQPVSFSVTVTVPPPIFHDVPGPITFQATSQAGAVATFVPPTASDVGGQSDAVTCDHLSGIAYPIGTTTVTCTASVIRNDSNGNPVTFATGSAQFTITITASTSGGGGGGSGGGGGGGGGGSGGGGGGGGLPDTTAPTIEPHPNLSINATTPRGAVVGFTVTAADIDNQPTDLTITCVPLSGATLPLAAHAGTKTTAVTCTARDPAGNQSAPMSFAVTVLGAHAQIDTLERQVIGARLLSAATRVGLVSSLQKADQLVLRHAPGRAESQMTTFVTAVRRCRASPATRRKWNAAAARIIAVLG